MTAWWQQPFTQFQPRRMTMFTDDQKKELDKPLMSRFVSQRTQGGRALSYIEGWHAIAEANRIFGPDCWDRELLEMRVVTEAPRMVGKTHPKEGWGVSYLARVRVTVRSPRRAGELPHPPIVKEGVGAGHGIDVDLGLAHESASKEAETDAMKRAMMMFGNPFGLALYDKSQANVTDVDLARLTEFEEQLDAATDLDELERAIAEYTPDIVELRKKRMADWQLLNAKVSERRKALAPGGDQTDG